MLARGELALEQKKTAMIMMPALMMSVKLDFASIFLIILFRVAPAILTMTAMTIIIALIISAI